MSGHPQRLGKYLIRSVLGRGAMGVVYEGFDPDIERTVAIKVIHPHLQETAEGQSFAERFRREARAAARCNHPNIVTVYELGHQEDTEFIVMEFVQGEELKYFLDDEHRFSNEEALHIASEVLAGLASAHRFGVVHRDIKPANIILLDNGSVKLADFGVARTTDSDLTVAGNMVGTPSYMCPEGLRGLSVDHRADIYSVGMVLLETLTGRKPDPQSLYTRPIHVFLDEVFGSASGGQLSGEWQSLLRKALAEDPEQRYTDAGEFLDALLDLQAVDQRRAASTLSETVIAQRPLIQEQHGATTRAPTTLSEDTLHKLEQGLASYIGPLASVLVRRSTASGITPADMVEELASHIDDVEARNAFLKRARHCIAGECSNVTITGDPETSARRDAAVDTLIGKLGEQEISQIGRALAHHLGPIGPMLVRREASRVHTRKELVEALASRIEDESERQTFLSTF